MSKPHSLPRVTGGRVVVRGGTVWTPDGPQRCDVGVEGGRIAELGELADRWSNAEIIDARGLDVLPGFIDVHVHIDDRIGAYDLADDFPSGTRAAIETGITAIAGFATQQTDESIENTVTRYLKKAAGRSLCDYTFHLTPTRWPWDWAAIERLVERGFGTFKLYTTYRQAGLFTSYERLEEIMERLAKLHGRLLLHCEDDELLASIDERSIDFTQPFSHTLMRPERAEVVAISRVIDLAKRTGCQIHIVHVSTAEGAELVTQAREHCHVTCETAPHYLVFNDQVLAHDGGHRLLCTPPLRSEATRARLVDLVLAGRIDLFATDHCAFTRRDKDSWRDDYRGVPCGVPGLGALVSLVYEVFGKQNGRSLSELVTRLAANPAKLLGLFPRKGAIAVGSDADLVIVDQHAAEKPIVATHADAYQPYPNWSTMLGLAYVLQRGRVVVRSGEVVSTVQPAGQLVVVR